MNWHDYFTYDMETGNLIWKRRPRSHFVSRSAATIWNAQNSGKVAGCRRRHRGKPSYVIVRVNGVNRHAHRIIWEMHNGPIPEGMLIDHIDCDGYNNRTSNIRLATHSQNLMNMRMKASNTSGYKGVYWSRKMKKWTSAMRINGRVKNFGTFESIEDAAAAYASAAIEHRGQFARLK